MIDFSLDLLPKNFQIKKYNDAFFQGFQIPILKSFIVDFNGQLCQLLADILKFDYDLLYMWEFFGLFDDIEMHSSLFTIACLLVWRVLLHAITSLFYCTRQINEIQHFIRVKIIKIANLLIILVALFHELDYILRFLDID